jgi:hypothetical protein
MATRKRITIEGITFDLGGPTAVSLERLYTWVVWQFPRPRPGGYSGAVHPSEPGHGWYPAVVDAITGEVLVYANVKERFPTPEAAAKHLDQLPDLKKIKQEE